MKDKGFVDAWENAAHIKSISEKLEQLGKEAEKNGLPWYMGLFNPEILKSVKDKQEEKND